MERIEQRVEIPFDMSIESLEVTQLTKQQRRNDENVFDHRIGSRGRRSRIGSVRGHEGLSLKRGFREERFRRGASKLPITLYTKSFLQLMRTAVPRSSSCTKSSFCAGALNIR